MDYRTIPARCGAYVEAWTPAGALVFYQWYPSIEKARQIVGELQRKEMRDALRDPYAHEFEEITIPQVRA